MPGVTMTENQNEELYFDLRPGGFGEPDGFWAVPLFAGVKRRIMREAVSGGREELFWVDVLKESIRDWQGFRSMDGEEIPCTPEQIEALCESDPVAMYALFGKLSEAGRTAQRNAEKN